MRDRSIINVDSSLELVDAVAHSTVRLASLACPSTLLRGDWVNLFASNSSRSTLYSGVERLLLCAAGI